MKKEICMFLVFWSWPIYLWMESIRFFFYHIYRTWYHYYHQFVFLVFGLVYVWQMFDIFMFVQMDSFLSYLLIWPTVFFLFLFLGIWFFFLLVIIIIIWWNNDNKISKWPPWPFGRHAQKKFSLILVVVGQIKIINGNANVM